MRLTLVLGQSGSGKTSLCQAMAGDTLLQGQIEIHSIGQQLRWMGERDPVIAHMVANGLPVPDNVIIGLISDKLRIDSINVIDNYPQTNDSFANLICLVKSKFGRHLLVNILFCARDPSFLGRDQSIAFLKNREDRFLLEILPFVASLKSRRVPLM